MGHRFYRLDGRTPVQCDMETWAQMMESPARQVASEEIEGVRVSTVFLGLDHNFFGNGPPLLFETMTFSDTFGEIQWRCSTYLHAEEMHRTVVELVRESLSVADETAQTAIQRLKSLSRPL
jgi:hypothetical protein